MDNKDTLFQKLSKERTIAHTGITEIPKRSIYIQINIVLITLAVCSFFFYFHLDINDSEVFKGNISSGNIWADQTMVAEFSFPINKDHAQYISEKKTARNQALPFFQIDYNAEIASMKLFDSISKRLLFISKSTSGIMSEQLGEFFTDKAAREFFSENFEQKIKELKSALKLLSKFILQSYRTGLLDTSKSVIATSEISVVLNNTVKIIPVSNLYDNFIIRQAVLDYLKGKIPQGMAPVITELIEKIYKPNLIFSKELTEKSRELAELSVPRTEGYVREGEIIIAKGRKVTDETVRKIQSYKYSKYISSDSGFSAWMLLGSIGHASLVYSILLIYLFILRKRIFYDNTQLMILSICVMIIGLMSWLSVIIPTRLPIEYFVLLPSISMLIAIVFDSRTAFYSTVTMSLMLAGIRGNDYDAGTAMMFAGIIGAYTVRDIQSRTQVFKSIFFIFIGFLVPVLSFGLERLINIQQTYTKIILSAINSTIAPMVTFGLLFIIERVTNISTDLRLQEFNNLNHPLLVKLSDHAPGTYQHSVSLGLLAEKCASAIGANQLLAKVGAYFHDIGKMVKPEYFIENQHDVDNKHFHISPKKSAELIRNHVLEGIRVGKEYKIPQKIIDFIPMHHGTFLIKHFYAKAIEEAVGVNIAEVDFRYPGPKPNSKETAIVMICDSAEALSRLPYKDKEELEKSIEKTISSRLNDGQFDDCSLTMNELHIIKDTCVKYLMGVSHQRVEYKEITEDKKNPD